MKMPQSLNMSGRQAVARSQGDTAQGDFFVWAEWCAQLAHLLHR